MKIGLIGLPNCGKTTVFNALAQMDAAVTVYASRTAKPNISVIDVIDDRLTRLSDMYHPKKTVYATIELVDFVGLSRGDAKEGFATSQSMGLMKTADALALVVRNYQDDTGQQPTPLKDIETVGDELLISDMILAENRLERIKQGYKRGTKSHLLENEEKTLRHIMAHLDQGGWIRDLDIDSDQKKIIRGFQFLTQKPWMVIVNSEEIQFGENQTMLSTIEKQYRVVEFAGKFEMELSRLTDKEDVKLFMADMGIEESARTRLTRLACETLGYISFFTIGSDEVRAWHIVEGETALKAAEIIHSDMARGFIRAECLSFDNLDRYGSEKAVREQGLFHLEGKDYIVQDGDIVHIRFNV